MQESHAQMVTNPGWTGGGPIQPCLTLALAAYAAVSISFTIFHALLRPLISDKIPPDSRHSGEQRLRGSAGEYV